MTPEPDETALDLYEHAPCGFVSTDPDGLIVRVNRTFLEWTGYAEDALVGVRRFQDLLTAGGRIYHETHYAPLLRMQGAVREIAVDIRRADGSRLPVLVNAVLVRDDAGAPRQVRTTVFDATDRKRYEEELLLARDRERETRARVERLQRVSVALAAAPDVPAIAAAVMDELVATFGPTEAGLAVVEEDGLRVVFPRGGTEPVPPAPRDGRAHFEEGAPARAVVPLGEAGAGGRLWLAFAGERRFSDDDRALITAFAGQVTLALERARLFEEQRDVAHVLQHALLAGEPPTDPRFDVAALYEPAGEHLEVGGDWYDTFVLPDRRIAVVVGDVVGRGLLAASAMGQLRSAVRALAAARRAPAELLGDLDGFVEQVPTAQYATLVYAEIDPATGSACVASAGHLPALLLRAGVPPELFMAGRSGPLGAAVPGVERTQASLELGPGDGFILYTDGLVERRGESIDAGLDRLIAAVGARTADEPAALVDRLARVLLPADSADDDVCLLCFTRRDGSG